MDAITNRDLHETTLRIKEDLRSKLLTMPPSTSTWWDMELQELATEVLNLSLPLLGISVHSVTQTANNTFRPVKDIDALEDFHGGASEWENYHPAKFLGE